MREKAELLAAADAQHLQDMQQLLLQAARDPTGFLNQSRELAASAVLKRTQQLEKLWRKQLSEAQALSDARAARQAAAEAKAV